MRDFADEVFDEPDWSALKSWGVSDTFLFIFGKEFADIKRICIPEERWNQQQSVIGYSLFDTRDVLSLVAMS
jgi:hypothetical protein